jgi:hypothetical protein
MEACCRWPPFREVGTPELIEETMTVSRIPRFMPMYKFVLAMALSMCIGFLWPSYICFVATDLMLTG